MQTFHLGLDIGSTTVKTAVLDSSGSSVFTEYGRHHSDARTRLAEQLREVLSKFPDALYTLTTTGSGAMNMAEDLHAGFVQEVIAASRSIRYFIPETDVVIELGGEDGKITFFDKPGVDQRMNESCAGGTGAFIDQMASVLRVETVELDTLASGYTTLYPIAARCGVFAKTDIMPLLNEGAPKADIAASILQAVVDQVIGGLACGRTIKGKVAFLGGPLFFLPALRKRFVETLKLPAENVIFPKNALFFVALGAAISGRDNSVTITSEELREGIERMLSAPHRAKQNHLAPLFVDVEEYGKFRERHDIDHAQYRELSDCEGDLFLGLDAGSTTTKAVLIDSEKRICYTHYGSNHGSPLHSAIELLKDVHSKIPPGARIAAAGVTGYGEHLIKAALDFDFGEVETVAHYRAAAHFCPEVSFILDIGGQDMKCIHVNDGVIDKIVLNEACSSGCGSFLETFASSLGLGIEEFSRKAMYAANPVDLGSRCTVFMNSKIRQAQKEGNDVADISAGLAYAVVRNALFKVIKIHSPEDLGKHVVVQGGTFLNDAVLRAFERTIGRDVTRADIAGLMGAFGIALLAREEKYGSGNADAVVSSLISPEKLANFEPAQKTARCGKCSNRCVISVSTFDNGKKFVSGNRCEKGAGSGGSGEKAENLFEYKFKRLFEHYEPLPVEKAPRGVIGIPRVLNMFEDYPLWFTFWTELGFRVELSDPSSRELYNSGLDGITSQAVCYPAKIVHGHIVNLVEKGVRTIFYPCLPFESKEFEKSNHQYNCPVVASYPEVVRLNMEILKEKNVRFVQPFLPLQEPKALADRLVAELKEFRLPAAEIRRATTKGFEEMLKFRDDIRRKGEELYRKTCEKGQTGIVLAGRPYHLDVAINHGIPDLISVTAGVPVFTEDSVAHLGDDFRLPLRVIDQWVYHGRLYRAANFVAKSDNLQFVQFNSFGCGIDAITTEEAEKILAVEGKNYTLLKIDEGSNLGTVRIRIRSLLATVKQRGGNKRREKMKIPAPVRFTDDMKEKYTILCPQMAPLHFRFLRESMLPYGYDLVVLPEIPGAIEEGLRYVNNDICFPAIVTIGQLIATLKSGKYDLGRTAMLMSQTIGGCRSTNYASLLRNAANQAGFQHVPIVTLNISDTTGMVSGFKVDTGMLHRILMSFAYGDLLMRTSNATRPYEKTPGSVDALLESWFVRIGRNFVQANRSEFLANIKNIVADFDAIPLLDVPKKPRVGIVGEILVKFHPGANNDLVGTIEREGGEAVVPDLSDFWLYCLLSDINRTKFLGGKLKDRLISEVMQRFIEFYYRRPLRLALSKSKRFHSFPKTAELQKKVEGIVSLCNQVGEGWLLVAEMVELLDEGVENVVCIQPFACLPNHITGRGVMKELKKRYPFANLLPMDFDPGISEVNQLNRIRLMMGTDRDLAESQ